MNSTRYSEDEVAEILRSADRMLGRKHTISEDCQSLGISRSSFYRWQYRYGLREPTRSPSVQELQLRLQRTEEQLAAFKVAAEGN